MTTPVIRLTAADAERYMRLRRRMLTGAPWAFAASLDDDRALDPVHLAGALGQEASAILAVSGAVGAPMAEASAGDLIAAAGMRRMTSLKFVHRATLWGVWVEATHRSRGLGRQVVSAALDVARGWRGVDYVDLGVSEHAPEAFRLYESLGFKVWGRQPESTQIGTQRYDEIYMTLRL